jgi:hypothetical protein
MTQMLSVAARQTPHCSVQFLIGMCGFMIRLRNVQQKRQ